MNLDLSLFFLLLKNNRNDGSDISTKICCTPDCGKPAKMACPKCVSYKLPLIEAMFCTQDCFKKSWNNHKILHKPAQEKARLLAIDREPGAWFNGYKYTGPLKAWRVTPRITHDQIPSHIRKPDYAVRGQPISEQRDRSNQIRIYDARQIEGIRRACAIGRQVLDIAGRAVRVGVTTDEIDRIVHEATIDLGAYPSPLNYYNFPKSVCTSVNEVICHGIPDKRELVEGDIVNIDISNYVDGYHGDLNETFFVGNCDEESHKLVKCAFDCLSTAASMIRPGTFYRDLGPAIHNVAQASGCSVVKQYCGHGIGELFHTTPNVPHYKNNKAKGTMKAGHIFTIEPMINLGAWQCETWPDQWTAVTIDGKRSAQFEHTFLVTEEGYEILTMRENEPRMEWNLDLLQR